MATVQRASELWYPSADLVITDLSPRINSGEQRENTICDRFHITFANRALLESNGQSDWKTSQRSWFLSTHRLRCLRGQRHLLKGNQDRFGGDLLLKACEQRGRGKSTLKMVHVFSLRERNASETSAPETAETFVFMYTPNRTWALAPGRSRAGMMF